MFAGTKVHKHGIKPFSMFVKLAKFIFSAFDLISFLNRFSRHKLDVLSVANFKCLILDSQICTVNEEELFIVRTYIGYTTLQQYKKHAKNIFGLINRRICSISTPIGTSLQEVLYV